MSKTMKAKTITITIAADPRKVFALVTHPETLPQWNAALCRSVRKEGEEWIAESPRGPLGVRWVREDRSGLVDLIRAGVRCGADIGPCGFCRMVPGPN